MDDYFPLLSCIVVTAVLVGCCLRYRHRQRQQTQESEEQPYTYLPTTDIVTQPFVLPPILPPTPTAPPMSIIYEENDPVV